MEPSKITPEILQKISQRCSGHAMKIFIPSTAGQIAAAMGSHHFRVVDASNGNSEKALDDTEPTIVTGCEEMSHTEFVCFVSQMQGLRFRNILIFPTARWTKPEFEDQIPFWDRMGTIMQAKFTGAVQEVHLNR